MCVHTKEMYYYIKHCTFRRYQPAISLLTVQKAKRLSNPSRRMQIMSMHSWTASPALQELSVSAKKRHTLNRKCNWAVENLKLKNAIAGRKLHPCIHECMHKPLHFLQLMQTGSYLSTETFSPFLWWGRGAQKTLPCFSSVASFATKMQAAGVQSSCK